MLYTISEGETSYFIFHFRHSWHKCWLTTSVSEYVIHRLESTSSSAEYALCTSSIFFYLYIFTRDFLHKSTFRIGTIVSERISLMSTRYVESRLRASDGDVHETTFLFERVSIHEGSRVREYPLLCSRDKHRRELESLGKVDRHE